MSGYQTQGAWSVDPLQKFSWIEKKKVGKIVAMVSINVKTDSTREKWRFEKSYGSLKGIIQWDELRHKVS